MNLIKTGVVLVLLVQPLQAQSLINLVVPPQDLAEECGYSWHVSPHVIVPKADPAIADSVLLEWLGPDNPVSTSVLDTIVTCVYASPDNDEALSLLIMPFHKAEQALVLYAYLSGARWLADRVELHGSIVFMARVAPEARAACARALFNETSDLIFEHEAETTYDRSKGKQLDGVVRNVLGQFWGRAARRDGTRIMPDGDLEARLNLVPRHDALRTLAIGNLSGNARRCGLEWEETFLAFMRAERSRFWDEKQVAFLGVLHGIGQRMTLNTPGECGTQELEDVTRSFERFQAKLKTTDSRRVWPH